MPQLPEVTISIAIVYDTSYLMNEPAALGC